MSNPIFSVQLRHNWGWFAGRGVAAIVLAVLAFTWPGSTLLVLTLCWGTYVLLDGVFTLASALLVRDRGRPLWTMVLLGLLSVAAGVVTFAWPGLTERVLLMVIAVWATLIGLLQIVIAIRIRSEIENERLLIVSGALSMLFGVAMMIVPDTGAVALVWLIATYVGVFGLLLLSFGFKLRKLHQDDAAPSVPA